ncbi:hypothetical protein [Uliginosibacterium gangwonense]|uniref:hypothetical protein n=1 Tax=Uliginosibacterium gangwonense TaxID=392736 RepID=UPI0003823609|nr:hypothetical protein [Uliginosibacterium gangwonense]
MTTKLKKYLRRYTDLPALLHILETESLTLLDPENWDDKNDSYYLREYKNHKKLKSLLALCFSQISDTYHHWHVFASGTAGVCIEFHRDRLLELADRHDIRYGDVNYLTLKEARDGLCSRIALDELPFIKRKAYKPEGEFRLIWQSDNEEKAAHEFPITLDCIYRITLSPWLHTAVARSVKSVLKSRTDVKINIYRSTLISNQEWKQIGDDLLKESAHD